MRDCTPGATAGGDLYNSMIAPFTVGPMAMTGAIWYQGEANVGGAAYYSCGFPSMITRWREAFKNSALWFGFVQIANFRYSVPVSISAYCQAASLRSHQKLTVP